MRLADIKFSMNFSDNLNLIFKAIPETLESGLNKGKVAYEVEVSDVSDNELVDTVNSLEKGIEVGRKNSFEIFQPVRMRFGCQSRKIKLAEGKLPINPPRSDVEMAELGKRRWVRAPLIL